MQAIILAAGKSTRMYPLTLTRPKSLIRILDKTVIEHTLDAISGVVEEAIIVVGYKKEMIIQKIGKRYGDIKITYVEQTEQLGTGHALLCAKKHIKNGKFLIIPGDDMFSKKDIERCVKNEYCVLAKEVSDPQKWGILVKDKKGYVTDIEEKPEKPKSNLASTGLWVMDDKIISLMEKQKKSERGELEITSALKDLVKIKKVLVETVQDYWLPLGYPWHVIEANVFMLNQIKDWKIKGKIEQNVNVEGDIFLEEGAVIKSGTCIIGPVYIGKNTTIGPMAYIRKDTIIMDDCNIRAEVFDSVIMSGTTAKHHCYLGHSVIGENANIAAGTITADYRHDGKEHIALINDKKVDTGRRKLGAFIGDNVMTGINTSIYPGRKIWPNMTTKPGEVVSKDITPESLRG